MLLSETPRVVAIGTAKREHDGARFALQIDRLRDAIALRAAVDAHGFEGLAHACMNYGGIKSAASSARARRR